MSLADLWVTNPGQLQDKHIQQIIAFAGSGRLLDGNDCSAELRAYLRQVPSKLLIRYAEECLGARFEDNGPSLQDVINEVGDRLGFTVFPGRYRGVSQQIGFDGLWKADNGHAIVVETKTTDTYRLDLNVIAGYRRALIHDGEIQEDHSSALIVVGREGTGELEAQIRGSRHAWDMRLISVDALLRLLAIKEELEDPQTLVRIREILVPREFTRVDGIIDLVFSTAESVKEQVEEQELEDGEAPTKEPKLTPVDFHEACIALIQAKLGQPLLRRSRAIFCSPDGSTAVVCAVSRLHGAEGRPSYWFAFHPHQKTTLENAEKSFVAFGCGSPHTLLLVPATDFFPWLAGMNTTRKDDGRMYWHVSIFFEDSRLVLHRRAGEGRVDLTRYLVNAVNG